MIITLNLAFIGKIIITLAFYVIAFFLGKRYGEDNIINGSLTLILGYPKYVKEQIDKAQEEGELELSLEIVDQPYEKDSFLGQQEQ